MSLLWAAVTFSMVRVCADVQVTLNVRIIVVGASEVGISLLETFAFWFASLFSLSPFWFVSVFCTAWIDKLFSWAQLVNMIVFMTWSQKHLCTVIFIPRVLQTQYSLANWVCYPLPHKVIARLPWDSVNGHASTIWSAVSCIQRLFTCNNPISVGF